MRPSLSEIRLMRGKFVVKVGKHLISVQKLEDLPQQFDHLIAFQPDFPRSPHTAEEHAAMETYNKTLQQLQQRARLD